MIASGVDHGDNLPQTLEYGYPSFHDEAEWLGAIIKDVFSSDYIKFNNIDETTSQYNPIVLRKDKYAKLQNQPYTRLIPGLGICCEKSCIPRFEVCFSCEAFKPSDIYIPYVTACIIIIQQRLEKLYSKKGGSDAIEFNVKQLALFQIFLSRIETAAVQVLGEKQNA